MRPEISALFLICAGYLITSSADEVSKPTIHDESTKDQLILDCVSSTPSVTYEWLDSQGNSLSTQQKYIATRPKEDVTLTCMVDNKVSQESQNITIPYSIERKRLSGCVISWIVVGVIVGVFVLLFLCFFCILSRFVGGGTNACMATGIMCCLGTCFCCKRNWKKGLGNIGNAILPFIEDKMGMKEDAENGEEMSPVEENAEDESPRSLEENEKEEEVKKERRAKSSDQKAEAL